MLLLLRRFSTAIKKKVFIETFGCQMNFNDTEIVLGILQNSGYVQVQSLQDADVALLMTCAIREGAESKVWQRLEMIRSLKRQRQGASLKVGVLGCMAERLKGRLLESEKLVNVVCGPDAYRDLPRLLDCVGSSETTVGMNVMLSAEETYADISPVRINVRDRSAFLSIMRGCNNMCSFCIVPFTRGRERSRPLSSIVQEIDQLVADSSIKEITLLGQNVNSYRGVADLPEIEADLSIGRQLASGFTQIPRSAPSAEEMSFAALLDILAKRYPDVRFRFTSPHPKDFPLDLLKIIQENPNISRSIHLPAQSGSTRVLERMRRGYTREAYVALANQILELLPTATISSDFIVGFCGETDEDHLETLSLLREVPFDMAYMFAYSMREKTHAHRNYSDDIPEDLKQRRLRELIDLFHALQAAAGARFLGTEQLVLVEGVNKRDTACLSGRSDANRTVVFERPQHTASDQLIGEFALVRISRVVGGTLFGQFQQTVPSLSDYHRRQLISK